MELLKKSNQEILRIVTPLMDNLMEASTEIDFEKHSRDFSSRIQNHLNPEKLRKICEGYQANWGIFEAREFVALFRRADSVAVIWKQHCSKVADEFVAEAVFKIENGKVVVDHVMVF
jgi:hypothetical protein